MSDLKPCPFCGGEDLEIDHAPTYDVHHPGVYEVHCVECGGRGGEGWTETEAIAAWNKRVKRYPESLAQRMIVDGYEYELFELRKERDKLKAKLNKIARRKKEK